MCELLSPIYHQDEVNIAQCIRNDVNNNSDDDNADRFVKPGRVNGWTTLPSCIDLRDSRMELISIALCSLRKL